MIKSDDSCFMDYQTPRKVQNAQKCDATKAKPMNRRSAQQKKKKVFGKVCGRKEA